MFLGAVVALALGAVPATQIQTQKPDDVAPKAEQEGRTGPAIPADQVMPKQPAPSTKSATSQAKADCAVKANSCETRCEDGKASEELSCKARCKKAELSCANPSEIKSKTKSTSQGRAPSHTSTTHKQSQPAPTNPE